MPINYSLRENLLTADPDDYMATVQSMGTLTVTDIIDRMLKRGSTLTREDALATMESYYNVIQEVIQEGYNVTTPTANFSSSIKGVFKGLDDSFDATRHIISAAVQPGKELRETMSRARPQKIASDTRAPILVDYFDFGSSSRNGLITPGNGGRISGGLLRFDATDPQQGIFFVAANGTATHATTIMRNKMGELIFIIPTLAAGEYTLQVRAMFGQSVRSGSLQQALIVP